MIQNFVSHNRRTSELNQTSRHAARKLTTIPLIAAIFFMVAGGAYGLEEIIQKAGFATSLLILLLVPLCWSFPTTLMLAELSSAIPAEGGFYVWVRRAMGPFWGFQEAWLSLAASVFDMAIYPTIFVLYLAKFWPWAGEHPVLVGGALIAGCTLWNLRGAPAVGHSSVLFGLILISPFIILTITALTSTGRHPVPPATHIHADLLGGIIICMWNFMGWDNATTVAGEVENPQRTYPFALIMAVLLVALDYILPVWAASRTGIDATAWETGSWVDAATAIGGPWLGYGVIVGGMLSGAGMFNALLMSYSRLPYVLAEDGFLPRIFTKRLPNDVPWFALVACAIAWTASLGFSFERLVLIDVMLYGISLLLEFVALVVLRIKEPDLPRPFRVPGGLAGAVAIGIGPAVLIGIALVRNRTEQIAGFSSLAFAAALIALGPLVYLGTGSRRRIEPIPATSGATD
jgi:amino acid transporter